MARALLRADRLVRGVLAPAGVVVFASALAVPVIGPARAGATTIGIGAYAAGVAARSVETAGIASPLAAAVAIAGDPAPAPSGEIALGAAAEAARAGAPGEVVVASWYGPGFYGNRLPCWQWLQSNGLPIALSAETWGVAHRTLPCGTPVVLSYAGRSVTAPVVDRGPYVGGRTLDLSAAVRSALGCPGLCTLLMHADD